MDLFTALTIGQSTKLGSFLNRPSIPQHLLTARLSALPSTSCRTSPRRTGRTSHGRDCASQNTPDQSACRSRHDLPNQTRCQFPPFFASRKMAAPSDFKSLADLLMTKQRILVNNLTIQVHKQQWPGWLRRAAEPNPKQNMVWTSDKRPKSHILWSFTCPWACFFGLLVQERMIPCSDPTRNLVGPASCIHSRETPPESISSQKLVTFFWAQSGITCCCSFGIFDLFRTTLPKNVVGPYLAAPRNPMSWGSLCCHLSGHTHLPPAR